MLAFATLCLSLFFSAIVVALPLNERDVFNPHITNPHEGTVWKVGTKETVTWETADIPPDSQLTNPNGRVILGFMDDDKPGLNLQLDHPLAQNFKLREGKVTITVPDVPPRDTYIVVLMGDSGNASPAFAITSISGGSKDPSGASSSDKSSATTDDTPSPSSSFQNSPPITGSVITGGVSESATASAPEPTATSPSSGSSVPSTASSTLASGTTAASSGTTAASGGTAAPAATSPTTNAAWSIYSAKLWSVIAAPLAIYVLI